MQATITAKGQVTVPKPIRDRLKLKPGDRVDFVLDSGDEVRVVPVTASVRQLKGMVPKPREPVTLEQMDDAIAKAYAGRR
ncbi:MAG: AbrB/MazE/SpoVT family DNA-binding domain-containing protein [Gammaproteobacteria bacterium]|nr:AbrB/MazE/SpoVT family DNA-binding domain-containing protein [Gammaproteobacteria bacterium]